MNNRVYSPTKSILSTIVCLGCVLVFLGFAAILGTAQETLPPYHWVYRYLDYLNARGFLPGLPYSDRPFSRQQIARHLVQIKWEEAPLTSKERRMLRLLLEEFRPEIQQMAAGEDDEWRQALQQWIQILRWELFPQSVAPTVKAGGFGEVNLVPSRQETHNFRLHPLIALNWQNRVTLVNNSRIFNRIDSTYIGKKFRNIYAYTEQGYLNFQNRWLQLKLGRDFFQIGPGRSGQLLISDNSRPFDMYFIRLGTSSIQFSFWGIQLNPRANTSPQTRTIAPLANRFLNGHRLRFNFGNKVFLGISEVILYGGPNANWELGYMNPFTLYYAHTVNSVGLAANSFFDFDWDLYLIPNLEIYGEFLVDDFQIDKKTPGDLEPNELGLILGLNWSAPFRLDGSQINIEYVQIRNRTYNAPVNDWEKYLHRNRVIGYYLGNNLERYLGNLYFWWRPNLQVHLFASLTRQGEGSVQGEFNKDYLNYTVEEGYSEPFPYGVVENHLEVGAQLFLKLTSAATLTLEFRKNNYDNYRHRKGNRFTDTHWRLNLWLEWDRGYRLQE